MLAGIFASDGGGAVEGLAYFEEFLGVKCVYGIGCPFMELVEPTSAFTAQLG